MKTYAILGWLFLITTAGYAMFHVSFEVEKLELELSEINRAALDEQEAIHVLRAEWSYLNRPDRLSELSRELLPHLQPPSIQQIMTVDQLPLRDAEEAVPASVELASH